MIDFGGLCRVGITSVLGRWVVRFLSLGFTSMMAAAPASAQIKLSGEPEEPSHEQLQRFVESCRSAITGKVFSTPDVESIFEGWTLTTLLGGDSTYHATYQKSDDPATSVGLSLTFDKQTKAYIKGSCVVKYDARKAPGGRLPQAVQFKDRFLAVIRLFLGLSEEAKEVGHSSGGRPYYVTCLDGQAIAQFATAIADNDGFGIHLSRQKRSNSLCVG